MGYSAFLRNLVLTILEDRGTKRPVECEISNKLSKNNLVKVEIIICKLKMHDTRSRKARQVENALLMHFNIVYQSGKLLQNKNQINFMNSE